MFADLIGVSINNGKLVSGNDFWIPNFKDLEYTKEFIPRYITKQLEFKYVFSSIDDSVLENHSISEVTRENSFRVVVSNYIRRYINDRLCFEEVYSINKEHHNIVLSYNRLKSMLVGIDAKFKFLVWESSRIIDELEIMFLEGDNLYICLCGNTVYTNQLVGLYMLRNDVKDYDLYITKFLTAKALDKLDYECREMTSLVKRFGSIDSLVGNVASKLSVIENSMYLYDGFDRVMLLEEDRLFSELDSSLFNDLDNTFSIGRYIYTKEYMKEKHMSNIAEKALSRITNDGKPILPRFQENGFYLSKITCENYDWRVFKDLRNIREDNSLYYVFGVLEMLGKEDSYREMYKFLGKDLESDVEDVLKLIIYRDDIEVSQKSLILEGLFVGDLNTKHKSVLLSKSFIK